MSKNHLRGTMKDANAAITLLEKWPEKIQPLNGIRTDDHCVTGAMLYQLSYQSHMRAVVSGFGHFPSIVMAAFTSFILSSFNSYCWTSITIGLNHFPILHMVSQRSKILSKLYFHSLNASKLVTQEASKRTDTMHCASLSKQYMTSYRIKTQILQIHAITLFEQWRLVLNTSNNTNRHARRVKYHYLSWLLSMVRVMSKSTTMIQLRKTNTRGPQ